MKLTYVHAAGVSMVSSGFARDESGQTIVEFALASFLFFTILFGILEFGQAIWRYNFIANLAQAGARRASVCGSARTLSSGDCNVSNYVTNQALGMSVTVTVVSAGSTSPFACTTTVVNPSTLSAGSRLCVQVVHTFQPLTRFIPNAALNLQATSQMIMAR